MKTEEQNERLLTESDIERIRNMNVMASFDEVAQRLCRLQDAKSYEAGIEKGKKEAEVARIKALQEGHETAFSEGYQQGKKDAAKELWALVHLDKWRCKHDSGYYCPTCKSDIYLMKLPNLIVEIQKRYGLEDKQNG